MNEVVDKVVVAQGKRGLYEALLIEYLECPERPRLMRVHPLTQEFLRRYFAKCMNIKPDDYRVCMVKMNGHVGLGFEDAVIEAATMPEWEVDYGSKLLKLNPQS